MRRGALIALAFLLCWAQGMAQQDAGTLRVLVEDASGAVVAGAAVTVTNENTGTSTTHQTGEAGYAVFSPILRGTYSLDVMQSGFRGVRVTGIGIDVNQNRLVRAVLEVAQVTETIEVVADAAALRTEEASLGEVVKGDVIVELPLAARRYTDLTLLVPGATESTLDQNIRGPGWLVVNGNYHTQNNFLLDGVDNNQGTTNLQSRSAQVVQPSPDTLAEFKVMTNNFTAEFGRSAGAVINASIRSGTNEVHGSAWFYNRPSDWAANSWRGNLVGTPKDELQWKQAGGTIGGPIVRNKLFYFADYEGFFSDTSELQIASVPTAAMKQGDFSNLTFDLVDWTTGQPFANNTIPAARIDALGKKVADLYPDPTLSGGFASSGRPFDNYGVQLPIDTTVHKFDERTDFYASESDRFFGRYSFNDSNLFKEPTFPVPADTGGEDGGSQLARNQSLALSWNRVISPTVINDFRFGYNRTSSSFEHASVGGMTGTEFGFQGLPPELDEVGGIPRIVMSNYHNLGTGPWRPQYQNPDAFQVNDTLSVISGSHTLKMGFDFRHKNNEWVDLQYRTVAYNFDSRFTGDDAADLLTGTPQSISAQTLMVAEQLQQTYAMFLQDDWKISPNLTVNLGMRYEYFTPFWGRGPNTNINVDLATGQLVVAPGGQDLLFGARQGKDKYLQDRDRNNFGPRLGLAYQLNSRLVLRGGWGIFYNGEDFHGSGGNLIINAPNTFPVTLQREGDGPPPVILSQPVPGDFLDPSAILTSNLGFQTRRQDLRTPQVQQWNAALQFQLNNESTLELAYVGNAGRNLEASFNGNRTPFGVDGSIAANRHFPTLGGIEILESQGKTRYNALQAKFERRFTRGWYNLTSYTYASGLSTAGGFAAGVGVQEVAVVDGIPTALRDREWGFHDQLTRHRLSFANIWEIPIGRNRALGSGMSRAADLVIGGWQLSTIITAKSGLPVNVGLGASGNDPLTGEPFAFLPGSGGGAYRPDRVGKPNTGVDPHDDRTRFLDVNAFRLQTIDTPGNSARNVAWGPSFANFDIGINKRFPINETVHVDFRLEMFNAFNHTNFQKPNGQWNSSSFGVINDAFQPRQMQWAVRVGF